MRSFTPPVDQVLRDRIIELVEEIIAVSPKVKSHYGRDLAMENEDALVSQVATVVLSEEEKMTVAKSEEIARPPFEWLVEITSDINEIDYLKHYLVRDNDMVLAHRKVLTEVDNDEAELVISELEMTLATISS